MWGQKNERTNLLKAAVRRKGIPSLCKCWRCREEIKDALAYYREDLCKGAMQAEEFPEKEEIKYGR